MLCSRLAPTFVPVKGMPCCMGRLAQLLRVTTSCLPHSISRRMAHTLAQYISVVLVSGRDANPRQLCRHNTRCSLTHPPTRMSAKRVEYSTPSSTMGVCSQLYACRLVHCKVYVRSSATSRTVHFLGACHPCPRQLALRGANAASSKSPVNPRGSLPWMALEQLGLALAATRR